MIGRTAVVATGMLAALLALSNRSRAQDVPGIEICTVEKTMERRTSCLQSNVEFLQRTMSKLAADQQQRLDAANRQIEGLKGTVAALQKVVTDLQAALKKAVDDQARKAQPLPTVPTPAASGGK
jgi:TolA-binding protein